MKKYLIILYSLLLAMPVLAQRTNEPTDNAKTAGDGEINLQQDFFDPTRKTVKQKEEYHFSYDWRIEVGYAQNQQRSTTHSNPFTHGVKIGATVDFNLPLHFSIQTGLAACVTYGQIEQHWRSITAVTTQEEYIRHGINQYYLEVPVRAYYTQKLWKDLNLFFYGGPKLQIGLAEMDWKKLHLSEPVYEWAAVNGICLNHQDRYAAFSYTDADGIEQTTPRELNRCNIQLGLGGGLEWDCYRLVSGYDFGLNNLVHNKQVSSEHMWQWGWYVSFAYRF